VFNHKDFSGYAPISENFHLFNENAIIHWDPLSGIVLTYSCKYFRRREVEKLPFEVITTVFNEKNQYFNVQYTTDPSQYI
jgi:hypothetical protein